MTSFCKKKNVNVKKKMTKRIKKKVACRVFVNTDDELCSCTAVWFRTGNVATLTLEMLLLFGNLQIREESDLNRNHLAFQARSTQGFSQRPVFSELRRIGKLGVRNL